jgi:glycyl-tRNA synthetase beta subunit
VRNVVDPKTSLPKRVFLRHVARQKEEATQTQNAAADAMRKKIFKRLKSDGIGQVVMHVLYHAARRIALDLKDLEPGEQEAKLAALFGPRGLVQDGDEYLIQGFCDAVEIIEDCGCLEYLGQVLDYETFLYLISH